MKRKLTSNNSKVGICIKAKENEYKKAIREFALNNDISLAVAKAMFKNQ